MPIKDVLTGLTVLFLINFIFIKVELGVLSLINKTV